MLARVRSLAVAALLAATVSALPFVARAQNAKITMLHINDVYEIAPVKGKGGFAPLATLVRRERAANANTVFTVGGDFLSPSLLSSLLQGRQMIDLFNALTVDLVGFGNHEFDLGVDVAAQRIGESSFPWVGTNVAGSDGKPFGGTVATVVKSFGDVKVGYLGLLTEETKVLNNLEGKVEIGPPVAAAAKAVQELKAQGVHVIVALTHMAMAEDRELARKVKGINVILGGHDHDPITVYEGGVLIHKSGYDAHYLGAIDIAVATRVTDKGPVTTVTPTGWRLIGTADAEPDAGIGALVKSYDDRLDAQLATVVGTTATDLDSRREIVRTAETNVGNLIADALRETLKADVGLMTGGGIRGDRLRPAGSVITRKDILSELPFGNVGVLITLKGADLRAALEHGVGKVEEKAGRFPQVAGVTLTYDPKAEPGKRVVEALVGGQPLDADATYKVATLDYLLGGGDGFSMLNRGTTLVDGSGGVLVATMVMEYISGRSPIAPVTEGRIRTVN